MCLFMYIYIYSYMYSTYTSVFIKLVRLCGRSQCLQQAQRQLVYVQCCLSLLAKIGCVESAY